MQTYQDFFQANGFVVIPNVLSQSSIQQLRERYKALLGENEALTLTPTQMLQTVGLDDSLLNEAVVKGIKEVFGGSFYLYPDFTIRQGLYIPWHTDVSYLSKDASIKEPQANFMQCSIYLQDNNEETGGGLEVIPGSHLDPKVDRAKPLQSAGFSVEDRGHLMQTKSGDLALWDSRIVHRSIYNVEPEEPKLAIQWTVSRLNTLADRYIDYMKTRVTRKQHVSDFLGNREQSYLEDAPNIKFPQSFSQQSLNTFKRENIEFVGF